MVVRVEEIDGKARTPDWYWKWEEPTFIPEEECFLERIANTIRENMEARPKGEKPSELMSALMAGELPVRPITSVYGINIFSKVLDCWDYIVKPLDLEKHYKLNLIAQLLWAARFDNDGIGLTPISYGDAEFGGTAVTTDEVGVPILRTPAAENLEGIENVKVPNVYKDGFYPKYLWLTKTIRNFLDKYDLAEEQSLMVGSPDPASGAMAILGFKEFLKATRENPDLAHKALKLGYESSLNFSKAVEASGADINVGCNNFHYVDPKLIKEYGYDKYHRKLYSERLILTGYGAHVPKEHVELAIDMGFQSFMLDLKEDLKESLKLLVDAGIFCASTVDFRTVLNGPNEAIRQDIIDRYRIADSLNTKNLGVMGSHFLYKTPLENILYTRDQLREIGRAFMKRKI